LDRFGLGALWVRLHPLFVEINGVEINGEQRLAASTTAKPWQ
jgi:hypothetical protein